jgi:hypothetical protein
MLGNGDGSFLAPVPYEVGLGPFDVGAADLNRDGRIDLAVMNSDGNDMSLLYGNGDGTLQGEQRVPFRPNSWPMYVAIADLNHDDLLDLAVTGERMLAVLLQVPPFCASQTDPSVIFCEDFSGADPLSNYRVENPPSPSGGQSPRTVAIDNERLVSDYLYGFGVAKVSYSTPFNFVDTILESDVRLEGSSEYRGAGTCSGSTATPPVGTRSSSASSLTRTGHTFS